MTVSVVSKFTTAVCAIVLSATGAFAQAPKATPVVATAQPTGPDMTTERFGDWVVVCSGQPRICESGQTIATESQVTIARIAVGRQSKDKPQSLVVVVPNNINIASGLKVTGETAKPPLSLPFKSCTPSGCFAVIDLSPDVIKDFKAAQTHGQISFESAGSQKVNFQFSFRGFDQAYDALVTRDK